MNRLFIAACLMAILVAASPAAASLMTFNFTFTGAAYGDNNAVATGDITFDSVLLTIPGRYVYDPSSLYTNYGTHIPGLVTALNLTVTGSTDGDGTFSLSNYAAVVFDTSTLLAMDLTKQLVGQATTSPTGKKWGYSEIIPESDPPTSYTGDFQLFASSVIPLPFVVAPSGIAPFQLGSNGAQGNDGMQLTSFVAVAVPEPTTYVLLALGLGIVGFARKRMNQQG